MSLRPLSWRMLPAAFVIGVLALFSTPAGVSEAAGFPVSVGTSAITGQEGKILLIFAEPQAGGTKVACIPIDAAVFKTPFTVLKEMPGSGNPCEAGAPDAFIVPGLTEITAGVYVGGSQTAEAACLARPYMAFAGLPK